MNLNKNDRFFFLFRELSSLLVKDMKDLFVKYVGEKVKNFIEEWDKFCLELGLLQKEYVRKMEEVF